MCRGVVRDGAALTQSRARLRAQQRLYALAVSPLVGRAGGAEGSDFRPLPREPLEPRAVVSKRHPTFGGWLGRDVR